MRHNNNNKVEARHANAHAQAIAFFSYKWFKYDILSLHCCKLYSVVDMMLSYQPSAPGFASRSGTECVMQYAGTGMELHEAIFLCFKTLHYSYSLRSQSFSTFSFGKLILTSSANKQTIIAINGFPISRLFITFSFFELRQE